MKPKAFKLSNKFMWKLLVVERVLSCCENAKRRIFSNTQIRHFSNSKNCVQFFLTHFCRYLSIFMLLNLKTLQLNSIPYTILLEAIRMLMANVNVRGENMRRIRNISTLLIRKLFLPKNHYIQVSDFVLPLHKFIKTNFIIKRNTHHKLHVTYFVKSNSYSHHHHV